MYGNVIRGKTNEPIAIASCFGWVLTGFFESMSSVNFTSTHLLRCNTETVGFEKDENFEKSITTFLKMNCIKIAPRTVIQKHNIYKT